MLGDFVDQAEALVFVDLVDGLEQAEIVVVGLGGAVERLDVLGEAAAAEANAGVEEALADAVIIAEADADGVDIGADAVRTG
jgi:hypothetical protein